MVSNVYLTHDRYYDDSIKGLPRLNCVIGAHRVYDLTLDTPMESIYVTLKVSENKSS